jgi:ABC-type sugar transport system permease subunit/outer membrane protein assembly factor BamB
MGKLGKLALAASLLSSILLASLVVPAQAQRGGVLWQFAAGARVDASTMSTDGERIAFGARDNILRVFDRNGATLWEFEAESSIFGADMSADGQWLAVASEDRNVYLLDEAGNALWSHRAQRSMLDAAVADDGSLVAASSKDRSIYILDGEGNLVSNRVVGFDVDAVAIYGKGEKARAVFGADNGTVYIYNRNGDPLLEVFIGYDVHSVAVAPNGARIVAGCRDGKAYYINGANGDVIWAFETGGIVQSVALAADDRSVLIGADDNTAYLVDEEGMLLQTIRQDAEIVSVAITADGSLFALGTVDNQGLVFDRLAAQESYSRAGARRAWTIGGAGGGVALLIGAAVLAARHTARGRRAWEVYGAKPRALARDIWMSRLSYLMILPTIVLLLTFNYYPAFSGLYHAFTEWNPGARTEWVGLENFHSLLRNRFFLTGLRNVSILVIANILKSLTVPLLVAELIFNLRNNSNRYLFRSLFIAPLIIPGVVTILLWNNIYDPTIGLLNQTLIALGLENWTRTWYGDPGVALASILFIGFPWAQPFALLIFYGGLISIPNELFDAGRVDGAAGLRRFWHIDLPLLMGQTKLLLMLGFIQSVQAFEIVYITTGGGPGVSTYTPVLELYYQAMRMAKFGVASAAGMFLFLIILIGTILNMRYVRSSTEFQA